MTSPTQIATAYLIVCPHGKTLVYLADDPDMLTECASDIFRWLNAGLVLERVTSEVARARDFGCGDCREVFNK